jgi:hypothetical protein
LAYDVAAVPQNEKAVLDMVVHIDAVGSIIDELTKEYRDGRIKGVLVTVVRDDGGFEISWSNNMSFLERLGLAEAAKAAMLFQNVLQE